MSEEDYNKKLTTLQQYIPFLDHMITTLKDPKMKNREQQLTKMEALHAMITDKKRKLKLETLHKCEDVLINLYRKVNHKPLNNKTSMDSPLLGFTKNSYDSPLLTPASPSPPREVFHSTPLTIPTERLPSRSDVMYPFDRTQYSPQVNVYSLAAESLKQIQNKNKSPYVSRPPDMSKPPISLEDLRTLEEDVQEKITNNASLKELDQLRNKIAHQIIIEDIRSLSPLKSNVKRNSTENKPSVNFTPPEEDLSENNTYEQQKSPISPVKEIKFPVCPIKEITSTSSIKEMTSVSPTKEIKSPISPIKEVKSPTSPIQEIKSKSPIKEIKSSISPVKEIKSPISSIKDIKSAISPVKEIKSPTEHDQPVNPDVSSQTLAESVSSLIKVTPTEHADKEETQGLERENLLKPIEKSKQKSASISKDDTKKEDKTEKDKHKEHKEKRDNKEHKSKHEEKHKSNEKKDKDSKSKKESSSKKSSDEKSHSSKSSKSDKSGKDKSSKHEKSSKSKTDKKNKEQSTGKRDKVDSKSVVEIKHGEQSLAKITQDEKTPNVSPQSKQESLPEKDVKAAETKTTPFYKRLADKYNPKPKKPSIEPEIDKTVSDIIEASMKTAPPKIPLLNPMPAPTPPSASLLACAQAEPELPVTFQNILTPNTTQLINNVVSQLRQNNLELEQPKKPSLLPTPPPLLHSKPNMMSPPDNFVSEYVRDATNLNFVQRPHFENHPQEGFNQQLPTSSNAQLNFVPPIFSAPTPTPPSLFSIDPFNQNQHFNQNSLEGLHNLDYYPPNAPVSSNQYNCGPPLLSPEVPHFPAEHKPNNFGMTRDVFSPNDDMSRWRMDDIRLNWDRNNFDNRNTFDNRYSRGPMTYREYREMKESRDPRVNRPEVRDSREIRDPRDNRDPRENRDILRDPRLQRDRNNRDQVIRDPRLNRGRSRERDTERGVSRERNMIRGRSRERDFNPRHSQERGRSRERERSREYKYDKFDKIYSRTNQPRSRSRSRSRLDSDETFTSPLNSLYSKEQTKTGKGYGVQPFRIPKIRKEETDKEHNSEKLDEATVIEDSDEDDKEGSGSIQDETEVDFTADIVIDDNIEENKISKKGDQRKNQEINDDTHKTEVKEKAIEVVEEDELKELEQVTDNNLEQNESNEEISKAQIENETKNPAVEKQLQNKQDKVEEEALKNVESNTQKNTKSKEKGKSESKNDESESPNPQAIFVQFFANLMKSQNKKDKKSAIASLITTFSDSFSPKELTKITKIIKAEDSDGDSSDEEDKPKKQESNKSEDVAEEPKCNIVEQSVQEEKIPEESVHEEIETDDESIKPVKTPKTRKKVRRISSTSPKKEEKELAEDFKNIEVLQEEQVIVSVGERIKSRKRSSITPPKPKKKLRTELDKLHEDIQDMFIRDGVLTATGRRVCHILKEDPNALNTSAPLSEELPKMRRKPGPKPKPKPNDYNVKPSDSAEINNMKSVRVVIPKIPESTIEERKTTRRVTRSMTTESDEDIPATEECINEHESVKAESDNNISDTEKDDSSQIGDGNLKIRVVKRKRGKKWASGIIEKKKKKDKQTSSENTEESVGDENVGILHDKTYFSEARKNQACKLCSHEGRFITTHYKMDHPDSEVLTSRFAPTTALEAIEDSEENLTKYEENVNRTKASTKLRFICRFCSFDTIVVPTSFYDHLSSHTGEYRHVCPSCKFSACSGKSLRQHITNTHEDCDSPIVRKTHNNTIQFGYMCSECNYVQMNEKRTQNHIRMYHSENATIHKVNMSTYFDSEILKPSSLANVEVPTTSNIESTSGIEETVDSEDKPSAEITRINENENNPDTPEIDIPKRKKSKPGPKSKKKLFKPENSITSDTTVDNDTDIKSVSNKEPNKSKITKERNSSRRSDLVLEEEVITPTRSVRAAKEKAQEKLKNLAESCESPVRKKPLNEGSNKTEEKTTRASSTTDSSNDDTSEIIEHINTKVEQKKCIKREVEMNVFTCNTDINEENKKIEQERLQMMDELNKSVGNRTSLNFVDKLCNRLNQNEVLVKQEPHDDFVDIQYRETNKSPLTMPVLEKHLPLPQTNSEETTPAETAKSKPRKPVFENEEANLSMTSFDVTQKNDKSIVNMIEKLKGKLASTTDKSSEYTLIVDDNDDDSEGPPPLTHVNELQNVKPLDSSAKIHLVGDLIKIIKTEKATTFCCLVPPCAFSTERKDSFQWHCKMAHKPRSIGRFTTLCEICGWEIKSSFDTNLLENLFRHTVTKHGDFLKPESEKSKVEIPLKVEPKTETDPPKPALRIRKLSGDALSMKKDWESEIATSEIPKDKSNKESENKENKTSETETNSSLEESIAPTLVELEANEDNPFPFKIAGVMSLAETSQQPPPLTPIVKPTVSIQSQQLVVKEAKLTPSDLVKPRKSPNALTKFLQNVGDLYKCPQYSCLYTSNFRDSLERHLKAHWSNDQEMVPCLYCDLKTPWEHVPMHIEVRHAHCRFACSYCLYRAVAKEYVFYHQDLEHKEKDYSVVALSQQKTPKKFAVAEQKIDPKTLCEPFRCTVMCDQEFLFLNEFRRHLVIHHKNFSFIMCGYKNCTQRISVDKMPQHWSTVHGVSLYQCGYCKMSSNDIKDMYYHFSQQHQTQFVDILVRMLQPFQDKITLGYSTEAFKKLRKVITIPDVIESKKEKNVNHSQLSTVPIVLPTSYSITQSAAKPITTVAATTIFASAQLQNSTGMLIPGVNATGKTFSLVTTTPTTTGNLIFLSQAPTSTTSLDGLVKVNSTQIITSVASPGKIVKVVPSTVSCLASPKTPLTSEINSITSSLNLDIPSSTSSASPLDAGLTPVSPVISSSPAILDIQEPVSKESSNKILPPVEQVLIGEESNQLISHEDDHVETENDPLDLGDLNESSSHVFSSDDESDSTKTDKHKKKIGLLGYQLFRCAFCDVSCSNVNDFKKHITKSTCTNVESSPKPFVCVHCRKKFKNPYALCDHIQCHGILRFTCSLCEDKFPTSGQARNHMKSRHNVSQASFTVTAFKNDLNSEQYIVRPKLVMGTQSPKELPLVEPTQLTPSCENFYMPEDVEKIPIRSIFSFDLKCGLCSYSTKVRTNIVRHLQFHSQEKAVPDTAPVNPVPCLEKNEKMFDKMINLASSSHTGRMGAAKDSKEKETEQLPEFVPSHSRYACCALGCQYICPEEANLRHHLLALHSSETSFVCVHCKMNLTPTDTDNLIKHLKLHGLQLFKCYYCSLVHHLKHKVEKHAADTHLDLPSKVITVRHLESEPTQEASTAGTPVTMQSKALKPWRCCMCKTRSNSQEGIQNHVLEKHEIDSQYKCTLCSYKTNNKDTFANHFKEVHDDKEIDIIYLYRKIEEGPKEDKEGETFDTTPLWQRDRPRVRHIRGILFDESTAVPVKSPKKSSNKTASITPVTGKATMSDTPKTTSSNNLDLAIESVANGTAGILQENKSTQSKEQLSKTPTPDRVDSDTSDDIIIIDDEEIVPLETKKDNAEQKISQSKSLKRKSSTEIPGITKLPKLDNVILSVVNDSVSDDDFEFSQKKLVEKFGEFGTPLNKQLKCPKCNRFKSKRISDFIFHLFKEMKVYRFKCGICSDESITYRYMYSHVKDHKTCLQVRENIIALPPNPKLEAWLQMLIQNQSSIVIKCLGTVLEATAQQDQIFQCHHCEKWYRSEGERNEHSITHWCNIPYGCNSCPYVGFTGEEIEKHFKQNHNIFSCVIMNKGPTISKELKHADDIHINEVGEKPELLPASSPPTNKEPDKEINIAEVNVPEIHIPDNEQSETALDPLQSDILESLDKAIGNIDSFNQDNFETEKNDLFIITRTDTVNVPTDGDVFCCECCAFMSNSEMMIIAHFNSEHEHAHVKFKVLNRLTCDKKVNDYVGCGLCSEVGSEIKIRQHHLETHASQAYLMYRLICSYCNKMFMKLTGLKSHSGRSHPGLPAKYTSAVEKLSTPSGKGKSKGGPIHTYKCSHCSYERTFPASGFCNVRLHVRNHYKIFSCAVCSSRFKARCEAVQHFNKEHPELSENILHDKELEKEYQKTIKAVQVSAKAVSSSYSPTSPLKTVARKSTGTSAVQKQVEEFSYYGLEVEKVDLTKIKTSIELNGKNTELSAQDLGEVMDLQPYVEVEDCNLVVDVPDIFTS